MDTYAGSIFSTEGLGPDPDKAIVRLRGTPFGEDSLLSYVHTGIRYEVSEPSGALLVYSDSWDRPYWKRIFLIEPSPIFYDVESVPLISFSASHEFVFDGITYDHSLLKSGEPIDCDVFKLYSEGLFRIRMDFSCICRPNALLASIALAVYSWRMSMIGDES